VIEITDTEDELESDPAPDKELRLPQVKVEDSHATDSLFSVLPLSVQKAFRKSGTPNEASLRASIKTVSIAERVLLSMQKEYHFSDTDRRSAVAAIQEALERGG